MPSTPMHVVLPAIMGYSFLWPYLLFLSYGYRYIFVCTCMPIFLMLFSYRFAHPLELITISSLINYMVLTLHAALGHLLGC